MKTGNVEKQIANVLKILGAPFRIKLLYCIGYGEACVCHLEAALKKRQAYISQHLMVLRDAGILETRRDGKYIFYRVADEHVFKLMETAAAIEDILPGNLPKASAPGTQANCACPNCMPEFEKETLPVSILEDQSC